MRDIYLIALWRVLSTWAAGLWAFVVKPRCPICGERRKDVESRRQNTAYVNDESNFVTSCGECYEEIQEYWAERWQEYYGRCL